jgi:ATP-dependent DNA helicase RecQ
MPAPPGPWSRDDLLATIERHWGFRSLRPHQEQAMRAVLDGRDSLVVLPTGGGKSLCYQAPAVLAGGTTVVISPLIALMKDQVDGLRACGVPAVQLDSSQRPEERFGYEYEIRQGGVRLLFVSPERLVQTDLYRVLQQVGVRTFAIDEAHCISHWGHDFRPEYRQLNRLREFFPEASVHAYTATATERVRHDIVRQLGLSEPEVLVGNFDRPNLAYRVVPRRDLLKQVMEVIDRHPHEAGIVYCIRRADVDDLTASLRKHGVQALPYHAGLSGEERAWTQEEFIAERCDLVVATVAFGMGIDRSNIRFVLHAAMPKSVEHYQQEAGRAGRDGLEAECVLLYSGRDTLLWKSIVEKSAAEAGAEVDPDFLPAALAHVEDMDRYCRGAVCRHRALVNYFGQPYEAESCAACDLCLAETELAPDATVVAQKVLSCVARVGEHFGIGHVVSVLRGENTEGVRKWRHEKLSTFGLLAEHGKADVRDWVYQLLGQKVLVQAGENYPVLRLNAASWEVMRGQRAVRLVRMARGKKKEKAPAEAVSGDGVDQELFEALRRLRRRLAEERKVPPYIVFTDATLRQLARLRPTTPEKMRQVSGVGEAKLRDFGAAVLEVIRGHGGQPAAPAAPAAPEPGTPPADQRERAFALFRQGASVEAVMRELGQGRGGAMSHLYDFVQAERPRSLAPWVPEQEYQRIAAAARRFGTARLQPIIVALGEQVESETVRLVLTHLQG